MRYYAVFDSVGEIVRTFPTYFSAFNFKILNHRFDWIIKELRE